MAAQAAFYSELFHVEHFGRWSLVVGRQGTGCDRQITNHQIAR
jgi:hypothetical protein